MDKESRTYFVLAGSAAHANEQVKSGLGFKTVVNAITYGRTPYRRLFKVVAERKSYISYDAEEVK